MSVKIHRLIRTGILGSAGLIAFMAVSSPAEARRCDVRSGVWPCFSGAPQTARKINKPSRRNKVNRGGFALKKKKARTKKVRLGKTMVLIGRNPRTRCFPAKLKRLIKKISRHYGKPIYVTSGHRSRGHNRRIGGARGSYHVKCKAVDFKVPGVSKYALARYVKRLPGRGGVGTYCGKSTIHLDVGPRRTWHWRCYKKRRYYAKRRYNRKYKRRYTKRRSKRRSRG